MFKFISKKISKDYLNVRYYTDYPKCNYSCPYCIAGHAHQKVKNSNFWDPVRYNRIIDNLCRFPRPINIRIGVGGEFFISKDLISGAKKLSLSSSVVGLNIITNLSFQAHHYKKILEGFSPNKLAIVASCHPTEIPEIDKWIDVARSLAFDYDLVTMVVAFPSTIERIPEIVTKIRSVGLDVFIQPFIGFDHNKIYPQSYSEEERELIRRLSYSRHDYEYLLNLKRPGLCHAGHTAFYIDPMGLAYRCGGGIYANPIGNLIESPHVRLNDEPKPCPFERCQCDTDNINTVDFVSHYTRPGINQHRFRYRFADEAKTCPWMDEWFVRY